VDRRRRLAVRAGILTPPCLVATLGVLTALNWSHLRDAGWSAVGYTDLQWPSILATGRWGLATCLAFLATGLAGLGLAWAARDLLPPGRARLAAAALAVMGLATCLVAFPADPIGSPDPPSWHDRVHDIAYPSLPVAAIAGMAWLALTLPRNPAWRALARASAAAAPVALTAFVLTEIDDVAQAARFALLGTLLLWVELVALTLRPAASGGPAPRASGGG
jgi:hypothetical protein